MSRYRELQQHIHTLQDISGIMRSMKALALLETGKLQRFLVSQQRVVQTIERMAVDFSDHFPLATGPDQLGLDVFLLLGSERGFCGDFNETLIHALDRESAGLPADGVRAIVVGHRLGTALEGDPRLLAAAEGPVAAEEVQPTLTRLVETLSNLQAEHGAFRLTALHHHPDSDTVRHRTVLPPLQDLPRPGPAFPYPPALNLEPERLLTDLADQYLFAVLNEMLYTSLMAENQRRVHHLDGALDRLDRQTRDLTLRSNRQRQEDITEEIEIILLNTGATRAPGRGSGRTPPG